MISCRRHEGVFKPREAGTIFSVYIYDIYCNVCSGSIWRAQSFGDDLKYIFTYLIIFALIMTIQYTYFR